MSSIFSGPSTSGTPDASDVAKGNLKYNRPSIVDPTGTIVQQQGYIDPTTGQFVGNKMPGPGAISAVQQNFNPRQQQAYDTATAIGQQMLDRGQTLSSTLAGQPTDIRSGVAAAPSSVQTDPNAVRQSVYDQGLALLKPGMDQQREQTMQGLADRGLPQGGEAFTNSLNQLDLSQNNALQQLANQAIQTGAAQQATNFGQESNLRAAGIGENQASQNQILNQIQALLGGNATFSTPMPQVNPIDTGTLAAGQLAQNNNAMQSQYQQSLLSGLFGIGGTLGGAALLSDRRAKTDIREVGQTKGGLPVYTYRYKHDPDGPVHMGVMAQEVVRKVPEAVASTMGGLLAVDYSRIA